MCYEYVYTWHLPQMIAVVTSWKDGIEPVSWSVGPSATSQTANRCVGGMVGRWYSLFGRTIVIFQKGQELKTEDCWTRTIVFDPGNRATIIRKGMIWKLETIPWNWFSWITRIITCLRGSFKSCFLEPADNLDNRDLFGPGSGFGNLLFQDNVYIKRPGFENWKQSATTIFENGGI